MRMHGQGATEYLVLLAVVLIIALVGIALLGFFPGTAGDAQISESQIYWKSANPIAVTETSGLRYYDAWGGNNSIMYWRIRNTGAYPISPRKIMGGGREILFYTDCSAGCIVHPLTDVYLSPGEEFCFGNHVLSGINCLEHHMTFRIKTEGQSQVEILNGAETACTSDGKGNLQINNFGFEYTEYVENQQITKSQIGTKPFVVKCTG